MQEDWKEVRSYGERGEVIRLGMRMKWSATMGALQVGYASNEATRDGGDAAMTDREGDTHEQGRQTKTTEKGKFLHSMSKDANPDVL
ncbi:Delt [Sesbania bispinosa]|nr:Delt [Sesbania bispinosa]